MVLVTGGSGFIGSYLLYYLLAEYGEVRASYRKSDFRQTEFIFRQLALHDPIHTSRPDELLKRVNWVKADLLDTDELQDLLRGASQVFHAAATVSFQRKRSREILRNNIEGTANVVNLCLENGIMKLAYVSSVASLPRKTGVLMDEQMKPDELKFSSVYSESKYRAEMEVWRGIAEGLPAVIINPGIVLGWGDFRKGSLAIFHTLANGLRYYPAGSNGFVDARDVARSLIALSKNENAKGKRFIAVSENLSYKALFDKITSCLGVRSPSVAAGKWMAKSVILAASTQAMLTGSEPFITPELVNTAMEHYSYSNHKLKETLGYEFISWEKTIKEAAEAYRLWKADRK